MSRTISMGGYPSYRSLASSNDALYYIVVNLSFFTKKFCFFPTAVGVMPVL